MSQKSLRVVIGLLVAGVLVMTGAWFWGKGRAEEAFLQFEEKIVKLGGRVSPELKGKVAFSGFPLRIHFALPETLLTIPSPEGSRLEGIQVSMKKVDGFAPIWDPALLRFEGTDVKAKMGIDTGMPLPALGGELVSHHTFEATSPTLTVEYKGGNRQHLSVRGPLEVSVLQGKETVEKKSLLTIKFGKFDYVQDTHTSEKLSSHSKFAGAQIELVAGEYVIHLDSVELDAQVVLPKFFKELEENMGFGNQLSGTQIAKALKERYASKGQERLKALVEDLAKAGFLLDYDVKVKEGAATVALKVVAKLDEELQPHVNATLTIKDPKALSALFDKHGVPGIKQLLTAVSMTNKKGGDELVFEFKMEKGAMSFNDQKISEGQKIDWTDANLLNGFDEALAQKALPAPQAEEAAVAPETTH